MKSYNKNIRICFFSGNISNSGGTERVSTIIANKLQERGYNVCFLSYENGKVSHYHLNDNIKLYTLLEKKYTNFFSRKIVPYFKLLKFIKKEKIDIIIDIDILLSLYTIPIKFFCKVKNISWEHFNYYYQKIKNRNRARSLAAKYSDCIITLNKCDLNNYKNNLKKIRRIDYIYNPSIVKSNKCTELKNKTVIAVGRLNKQKGFDILLKIWAEIEKKEKCWKLLIIGDGEERESLLMEKEKLDLKNVEILPFKENIEEYYEKSSIYALTSRCEGFPMVLLEAQKKGLPIVSFDCKTGPSEIVINNRNGFLIEDKNEKRFSSKLLELMKDAQKLKEFSDNSILDSKRFDINLIIDKWEMIIQSL